MLALATPSLLMALAACLPALAAPLPIDSAQVDYINPEAYLVNKPHIAQIDIQNSNNGEVGWRPEGLDDDDMELALCGEHENDWEWCDHDSAIDLNRRSVLVEAGKRDSTHDRRYDDGMWHPGKYEPITGPAGAGGAPVNPAPGGDAGAGEGGDTPAPTPEPAPEPSPPPTGPVGGGSGGIGRFSSPHQVIYAYNPFSGGKFPTPAELGGFNRLILAFYTLGGYQVSPNVVMWTQMSAGERQAILDEYHKAGIALMIAVFGQNDKPTASGTDAAQFAGQVAQFAKEYSFDGVDIDYEDFDAMNSGTGIQWLETFQNSLRGSLGDDYLISHAPIAPWFTPSQTPDGGYATVFKTVGSSIDFFNIQYYNQEGNYQTCDSLITNSGGAYPESSIAELHALGIPWEKIVLGKPSNPAAAASGYMEPEMLGQCLEQGASLGWAKQAMFWEWEPASVNKPDLLTTVLNAWPKSQIF